MSASCQVFDVLALVIFQVFGGGVGIGFYLICRVQQRIECTFVALQQVGQGQAVVVFIEDVVGGAGDAVCAARICADGNPELLQRPVMAEVIRGVAGFVVVAGTAQRFFVAAFFVEFFDAVDNEFFELFRLGCVVVELCVDFRAVGFGFADVCLDIYLIVAGFGKALVVGVVEVVARLDGFGREVEVGSVSVSSR